MGVQISNVLGAPKTVTKAFGDDTLTVSYHVDKITPEFLSEQQAKAAEIDAGNGGEFAAGAFGANLIALMLADVVVEWDLMDGDKVYPLTVEALRKLGIGVLTAVWEAVQEDSTTTGKAGNS